MVTANLTNLVLKTVTAGNKLVARADRIGSGFAVVTAHAPATFLSRGQFPLPRLPEPDSVRPRREVADAMSMPPAAVPASSAGSASGAKVCRASELAEWLIQTDPPAASRRVSPARYPGLRQRLDRLGRDGQSPDRLSALRSHAAKAHTGWRRTTGTATATAK